VFAEFDRIVTTDLQTAE